MSDSLTPLRPSRIWYAVSLAVMIGGIGLACWKVKSWTPPSQRNVQPVRGRGLIQLDQQGSHSLYIFRGASHRMDASSDQAWETARSARVVVREEQSGGELALRDVYETMDLQNSLIARLVEFEAPSPGNYTVQIEPSLEVLKPSVRPTVTLDEFSQEVMGFVTNLLIGFGTGALSIVIAVVIFLVVLLRRKKCMQQRMSLADTPIASAP